MLKALRGLVLAAGVTALPAIAQAECPPQSSIDRYAQTARDALVALDGVVPEEQQRVLEDRYAAFSILRWSWQGRDAILGEQSAMDQISKCIAAGRCDAEASERPGPGPRVIRQFPSNRLVTWARSELECDVAAPEVEVVLEQPPLTEPQSEPEAETETVTATIPPVSDPETREPEQVEVITSDSISIAETPEPIVTAVSVDPNPPETTEPTTDLPEFALAEPEPENTPNPEQSADSPPALFEPAPSKTAQNGVQKYAFVASISIIHGDFAGAMDTVSRACFLESETLTRSDTCDMVFDVYDRLGIRADPVKYLAFADQLCRVDYELGCERLATYFGVTTTADAHLAAVRFYDRACNSGDADACAAASDYFLTGRASIPDPERARDTLYRSCDLGRLASCQDLADFYIRGVGGDVDADLALEMNEISCPAAESRYADICVDAANFALLNLESGPERAARVRSYTERACRIGHDVGCAWYADNLEFGIGGDIDLDGARQARLTACKMGHEASCDAGF